MGGFIPGIHKHFVEKGDNRIGKKVRTRKGVEEKDRQTSGEIKPEIEN